MAVMVGTGLGARNGILFKNASALEDATRLDIVVFDKTGTLTMGEPQVVEVVVVAGSTEEAVLALAGTVEQGSDHPLAQAIQSKAEGLQLDPLTGFTNIEGKGARAEIGSKTVLLGNRRLMDEEKVDMASLKDEAARLQSAGQTVVHVAQDESWSALSPLPMRRAPPLLQWSKRCVNAGGGGDAHRRQPGHRRAHRPGTRH
ncbi:HAD family hydrolase [Halopseudomonas pachastrellae]|nr:HAD family hydrolase [Halopseudomonas pachastrellae]